MSKNTFIPTTKGLVSAHKSQDFTSDQKAQARTNIAAAASTHTHSADDIVSGALAKARQHAQTAYLDASSQTFCGTARLNDLRILDGALGTYAEVTMFTGLMSINGNTIPFRNVANTWTQAQTFNGDVRTAGNFEMTGPAVSTYAILYRVLCTGEDGALNFQFSGAAGKGIIQNYSSSKIVQINPAGGNVEIGTGVPANLIVNGQVSAATDFRLGGFPFSRVAQLDGAGGWGGGYNFNVNSSTSQRDSTGTVAAIRFEQSSVQLFCESSGSPGAITPRYSFGPTQVDIVGDIKITNGSLHAGHGTTYPASANATYGTSIGYDANLEHGWIQAVRFNVGEIRALELQPLGGNVMIGTTANQSTKFHVQGTSSFSGDASFSGLLNVANAATFNGAVQLDNATPTQTWQVSSGSSAPTYTEAARQFQIRTWQDNTTPFGTYTDLVANSSQYNNHAVRVWVHTHGTANPVLSTTFNADGSTLFNGTVGVETDSPLAKVHVGSGTYNPSGDTAVLISRNIVNSGVLFDAHGFVDVPIVNRSGGMGYASLDSRPSWTGSNNYDHALTLQSFPVYGSSGTMTNFNGMIHGLTVNTGTVTNSYGIELRDATGTGSVTTQYGLYVASMTKAATNWAIYVDGTTPSYIGGPVGIGRAAPAAGLAVQGEVVVGSTKPITISGATGIVTHKGTSGGYMIGNSFKGSADTAFGDFGVVGTNDTLDYFYVGTYGDELATFSSSGNSVKGGVWHSGGGNQRIYYAANGSTYHKGHGSLPHIWYDSTDTTRMYLDSSGNLTATGKVIAEATGKLGDYTVGTLPSAASNAGHEANVTDSSVTTFGSTVAGSGSSRVKVYSNGTNWTVQAA